MTTRADAPRNSHLALQYIQGCEVYMSNMQLWQCGWYDTFPSILYAMHCFL